MDLRAELRDLAPADADRLVAAVGEDWRRAELGALERALCVFAEKLTLNPGECSESDVHALREVGLDDAGIHRVAQIVGYFNYINRIADGLGVDLEPEMGRPNDG